MAAAEPAVPERAHLVDDRQQAAPLLGERVLDPRRRFREAPSLQEALVLERAQALGERARADPRTGVLELAEAPGALGKVVNDQRRPLGADDLGGRRHSAAVGGVNVRKCPHAEDSTLKLSLLKYRLRGQDESLARYTVSRSPDRRFRLYA